MPAVPEADISFYQQLGVEPTATTEQIRENYRSLVRLLHPDQQTDPQLKAIAEAQMRMLNRIHGVLSDPAKRAQYDLALSGAGDRPTLVFSEESAENVKKLVKRGGLALIGLLVLGGVIWSTSSAANDDEEPAAVKRAAVKRAPAETSAEQNDEIARLRAEVRSLEGQRNRALEELARQRGGGPPVSPAAPAAAAAGSAATGAAAKTPTAAKTATPVSQFGGNWYWTRSMDPLAEARGPYSPESIEAAMTETGGMIRGTYKARYRVPDPAMNPDVSFEFTATLAGPILISPWTGPGGARGQVMIRQTSKDSLQIDWTANQLGVNQKISTGTAVLARKN